MKKIKVNPDLETNMKRKALHSLSKFRISAIAFDHKGDILGCVSNSFPETMNPHKWNGGGKHAERKLIKRYGYNIKTILICRTSKTGKFLPIDPCPTCQKVARKMGIRIYSILPGVLCNYNW